MLGQKSAYAPECFSGGFIGADFGIHEDLSQKLPEGWRGFNKQFIPVYLANRPEKTKIGAGLACGALWTVSKGIKKGDIVLSPDGAGPYRVGEVIGDYYYAPSQKLPHRRKVNWRETTIARSAMSEAFRQSASSAGTVSELTAHCLEIEQLLGGSPSVSPIIFHDPEIDDPVAFAMEKHLEAFLVELESNDFQQGFFNL